jgi:hypothetical protein
MVPRIVYVDGEAFSVWTSRCAELFCEPEDLSRYAEEGRWDLVFNALYHLAGAVDEGFA